MNNVPMCQLAALWQTCRMVIGTLAHWHIGTLANYSTHSAANWHIGTLANWQIIQPIAQPIGTLAYWQIGKLFNCNASFIFTFRIIAVLFFIDNKPLY